MKCYILGVIFNNEKLINQSIISIISILYNIYYDSTEDLYVSVLLGAM